MVRTIYFSFPIGRKEKHFFKLRKNIHTHTRPPPHKATFYCPPPLPVRLDRNLEFDLVNVEDSAEYCGNCVFFIRIEFRLCSVSDLPVQSTAGIVYF